MSQKGWADGFDTPGRVIVDEIHSFAESKRGTLLALTLERLEAKRDRPLAADRPVGDRMAGRSRLLVCFAEAGPARSPSVDVRKVHRLEIAVPPLEDWLPPAGHNPYRIAKLAADLVEKAQCTLIFTTTRSAAERLALALKILLPQWDEQIAVHHSSIERSERLTIEEGLSEGSYKAVVASSSLELGVDFQAVDQVLLIGTPRGVSRALQRLGAADTG